ncbi:ParA family protein [Metapseudomonas otitidis]|uniref:ParA family protein n=1 Tax=Metapseudomonas otitidis TaxID=319939 RepID=UPI000D19CA86|nr:ParA family protein [Pseudomonas otitidis]
MGKIFVIANQKGGVGKTAVTVGVTFRAKDHKLRVLIVDFDRQGSASGVFETKNDESAAVASFSHELFGEDPEAVIVPEDLGGGLHILRADPTLSTLTAENIDFIRRPAHHLRKLAKGYDVVIVDTPGILGDNPPMTLAALIAADAVVCPFSVGRFELDALPDLLEYIVGIKKNGFNPRLRLMGLLPSKINTKSANERQAVDEVREVYGDAVLPCELAERSAVKQAIYHRKPVWRGTRGEGHRKAAQEWMAVTDFLLKDLGVL